MYIKRQLHPVILYFISWRILLWSIFTGLLAMLTFQYLDWHWVAIPWLPVSLIGTAVAFFVGFKNNQSYDRIWEARKIWGSITNLSRSFAAAVRGYVAGDGSSSTHADHEKKILIYRHIAWMYALRHAMRQRTTWEHQTAASRRQRTYFERHVAIDTYEEAFRKYLSKEEQQWIGTKQNAATQLLDRQSQHLAALRQRGLIDDFRQMELQNLITALFAEQGGSERIKNTPLPRQYSTSSTIFILIFTLLLPFGMLTEFGKLGETLMWLLVPFNLIVSWVFSLMEYVGDYSENPFEGLINDVPLTAIVRSVEIDLLDMLGEKDLPEKIKPLRDVLF
jgi:ion channel-forming bestrophin family protein